MARVFKQLTTRTINGRKVRTRSFKWYVEYSDGEGIRRRVPGYRDKAATQQLGNELERKAERRRAGLVDRFDEHRQRLLREHVDDWRASLVAKGTSECQADQLTNRVRRVFDGCGFHRWPDLRASSIQSFVAGLRAEGRDKKPGKDIEHSNSKLLSTSVQAIRTVGRVRPASRI